MTPERFNVVLEGTTLPGYEPSVVKAKLATLIKRDVEFAGRLLSGRPTTLKSGVDAVTGDRYVSALARAGVAVHLEPESLEVDANLSVPVPTTDQRQSSNPAEVTGTPVVLAPITNEPPTPNPSVAAAVIKAERVAADGTLGGDVYDRNRPSGRLRFLTRRALIPKTQERPRRRNSIITKPLSAPRTKGFIWTFSPAPMRQERCCHRGTGRRLWSWCLGSLSEDVSLVFCTSGCSRDLKTV